MSFFFKKKKFFASKKRRLSVQRRSFWKRKTFKNSKVFTRTPSYLQRGSLKKKFYQAFIVLMFFFLVYFLFFANYFQIQRIVLINPKTISQDQVNEVVNTILNQRRFLIFPGKNIFLINKNQIETSLYKNFPQIESLKILKRYPDVLKINIDEMEPFAIWKSKDKNFYIDYEGRIRSEVDFEKEEKNLFEIIDESGKDVVIGENVMFVKHVNFIKELYDQLLALNIKISKFIFPSPQALEIHVETEKGWQIYFILEKSQDVQINKLKLILEKELFGKTDDLDYIDLRIENWVYYKKKTASSEQKTREKQVSDQTIDTENTNY